MSNKRQRFNYTPIIDDQSGLYIVKQRGSFFIFKIELTNTHEYNVFIVQPVEMPVVDINEVMRHSFDEYGCISTKITLYDNNGVPGGNTAYMEQVCYDEQCAIGNLERIKGTEDMINATLFLCGKLFKVRSLFLEDQTSYVCNVESIPMQNFNFLVYGKSYYERKFNAKPSTREKNEEWNTMTEKVQYDSIEPDDADAIVNIVHSLIETGYDQENFEIVRDAVNSYIGFEWIGLFGHLYGEHGSKIFTRRFVERVSLYLGFIKVDKWKIFIRRVSSDVLLFKAM